MVIQPLKPWMLFVISLCLLALGVYFLGAWLLELAGLCAQCSGYATTDEALNMGAGLVVFAVFFFGVAVVMRKVNR